MKPLMKTIWNKVVDLYCLSTIFFLFLLPFYLCYICNSLWFLFLYYLIIPVILLIIQLQFLTDEDDDYYGL